MSLAERYPVNMQPQLTAQLIDSPAASTLVIVPSGTDRRTMGRKLAAHLITGNSEEYHLVHRGIHPDLIEPEIPKGKKHVGIDQIRKVIHETRYAPQQGKRKVCLIEMAEELTVEAANALLKTLEEPSPHFAFILLTENAHKILTTIRSRSRTIRLTSPSQETLRKRLRETGYDDEQIRYILLVTSGNPQQLDSFYADVQPMFDKRDEIQKEILSASIDNVMELAISDCSITSYEATVALLQRLVDDNVAAVTGAQFFARKDRETIVLFLTRVLHIARDLLHSTIMPPKSDRTTTIIGKTDVEHILAFSWQVSDATDFVGKYGSVESVLLSVFIAAGGLADG